MKSIAQGTLLDVQNSEAKVILLPEAIDKLIISEVNSLTKANNNFGPVQNIKETNIFIVFFSTRQ